MSLACCSLSLPDAVPVSGGGAAFGGVLRARTIRCAPRRVHRAVLSHPLTAPRHRNRLERGERKAPADRSAGAPGEKQEDRTSRSAQARKREISMPRVSMTVNGRQVSGDVEGRTDRKSVVEGKSGSVRVDLGGRRNIK